MTIICRRDAYAARCSVLRTIKACLRSAMGGDIGCRLMACDDRKEGCICANTHAGRSGIKYK